MYGSNQEDDKNRMSTSRCSELMVTAVANRLSEVWIVHHPFLLITYCVQFFPSLAYWLVFLMSCSSFVCGYTIRGLPATSPSYLQSCFTRVSNMTSWRRLRSSTSHRLDVPPLHLSTVGKRAFPVSGATVWNDLPLHVASAPSLETCLFSCSYQGTVIWLVCYYHHSSLLSGYLWSLQYLTLFRPR